SCAVSLCIPSALTDSTCSACVVGPWPQIDTGTASSNPTSSILSSISAKPTLTPSRSIDDSRCAACTITFEPAKTYLAAPAHLSPHRIITACGMIPVSGYFHDAHPLDPNFG